MHQYIIDTFKMEKLNSSVKTIQRKATIFKNPLKFGQKISLSILTFFNIYINAFCDSIIILKGDRWKCMNNQK